MNSFARWMELPFFWPALAGVVVLVLICFWLLFRYLRLQFTHRQLVKSAAERLARDQKEIARLKNSINTIQDELKLKKDEIARLSTSDRDSEELFLELEIRLLAEEYLTTHQPELLTQWEEAKKQARQKIQDSTGWKKWWKILTSSK